MAENSRQASALREEKKLWLFLVPCHFVRDRPLVLIGFGALISGLHSGFFWFNLNFLLNHRLSDFFTSFFSLSIPIIAIAMSACPLLLHGPSLLLFQPALEVH